MGAGRDGCIDRGRVRNKGISEKESPSEKNTYSKLQFDLEYNKNLNAKIVGVRLVFVGFKPLMIHYQGAVRG